MPTLSGPWLRASRQVHTWQVWHPQALNCARAAVRWFPVHKSPNGALSQPAIWTKSFPPFLTLLSTQPWSPLLPTVVYLQTLFLWTWLLIIIGLIKGIVMKVWMTSAIETFQVVLCIQIHLCMVKWIRKQIILVWRTIPENSPPKTDPIRSLDSFVYNSILPRLLNAQTLLGGDSVGQS